MTMKRERRTSRRSRFLAASARTAQLLQAQQLRDREYSSSHADFAKPSCEQ
jgi:hypothetical protein